MKAITWNVGNNTIELISDGRFKVVKINGDVVFDNLKNGGSFNAFWKKLQSQMGDQEWIINPGVKKPKPKSNSKNKSINQKRKI